MEKFPGRRIQVTGDITPSTPQEIKEPPQLPEDYLFKIPGLHARLNESGTYVVCGAIGCGGRIATVHENEEMNYRYLQFLPGWAPQLDGIWVFSRHAKLRNRHGLSVKGRRNPLYWVLVPNTVMDSAFDPLPARAKCSVCRSGPNILTRRGLGS